MKDLIEALQIFLKYKARQFPTHCEHDILYVVGFGDILISPEDTSRLNALGFDYDEELGSWCSYRFGSA